VVLDIYSRDFQKVAHIKCIRTNQNKENFIIVVREEPRGVVFPSMIISKKGYEEFVIPIQEIGNNNNRIKESKLMKFLQNKYPSETLSIIKDTNNLASKDIAKIEIDSPQIKTEITIGVIYTQMGQTNPLDMFANQPSDTFETFLKAMNIKTGTSELKWRHLTITSHVAPYLNSEEHRRCVGNSPSIIFFKDEGEQFDASEVDKMGMVPQIFIVVQPYQNNYRVGFFHSGNLKSFGPDLSSNLVFSASSLADFIYTKVHNGNVMFYYTNPMNRAFMLTRQSNIDTIVQNSVNKKYH